MLQTGELLYSGEERAPPLLVLLPPEVEYRRDDSHLSYYDDNQGSDQSGNIPGLATWSHNLGSDQGEAKTSGHPHHHPCHHHRQCQHHCDRHGDHDVVMAGAMVRGDTERKLHPSRGDAGYGTGRIQVSFTL